jgi:hypothetical protein
MLRNPIRAQLPGIFCISALLIGCAARRPIPSGQASFRLQTLSNGPVVFAPDVPESQTANAAVTLSLEKNPKVASGPSVCISQQSPFRLEYASGSPEGMKIVLPAPEIWVGALEGGTQSGEGDVMESFHSFLADLDRFQEAGCFASINSPIRDYLLQSMPMRPSDSLFNAYGYRRERSGLDLRPGVRLKIDRAYFRPAGAGEEEGSLSNYLGVSTLSFDVGLSSDGKIRFREGRPQLFSPDSLKEHPEEGSGDLALREAPEQPYYRLLFYTYVVPSQNVISAAIIGASNASQLDEMQLQLSTHPEDGCSVAVEVGGQNCFEFKGFVTLSAQVRVELNGKSQFVDWGTKVRGVVPSKALKALTIQRQFMGAYYDVRFDPTNTDIFSLTLVGGDRLSWLKRPATSK